MLPLVCLASAGCTETDDVFRDIGTTIVYFVDPELLPQGFTDPDARIQAADWEILAADFDFDDVPLDLRFGEECIYADSAFSLAVGLGKCASGVVVDSSEDPVPVMLDVRFTMQVKRARPLILPDMGDFDGDGRLNATDNCVLVSNPDQQDLDSNGVGDTCSLVDVNVGAVFRDSDIDGVADIVDNCLWVPNPFQTDSSGGIPDGIGDACDEQVAEVRVGAEVEIQQSFGPVDLVQLLRRQTFLTVDFNSDAALSCDWEAGVCQLDPSELVFCVRDSIFDAGIGCP